jgi:hypothetical protein
LRTIVKFVIYLFNRSVAAEAVHFGLIQNEPKDQAGKNLQPTGKTPWPGFPAGLSSLLLHQG